MPRALSEIQVLLNKTATDSTDPELKTAEGGEEGAWEESGLCNPTTDRRGREGVAAQATGGRGWREAPRREPSTRETLVCSPRPPFPHLPRSRLLVWP